MTPHMDIAPLKHACRKPTAKNIYAEPTKPTPPRPKPPQSKTQFKWYINRFRCKEIALLKCGRRPEWVPNTLVKSVCKSTFKQVFQTRPGTCQQSLWRGHRNQNLGPKTTIGFEHTKRGSRAESNQWRSKLEPGKPATKWERRGPEKALTCWVASVCQQVSWWVRLGDCDL